MKVLMLNGSPRPNGNTSLTLAELERTFATEGIETEIIPIGNQNIRGCIACGYCKNNGKCVFDDCVNDLARKFEACDGMIVPNFDDNSINCWKPTLAS